MRRFLLFASHRIPRKAQVFTWTKPSLAIANRSQNRVPLQVLEEGRDSITSIKIQNHLICTGSVDGRVRTYDLRMGQLQIDFFDRECGDT